jgi:hypothetical protein
MSDVSNGPGWWKASDLKWYPPETHPDYVAPETHDVTSREQSPPRTISPLRYGVAVGGLIAAASTTLPWGHIDFGTISVNATVFQTHWMSLIPHDGDLFIVVGIGLIALGLAQFAMTRLQRSMSCFILAVCVLGGLELVSELNILAINLGSPNASLGLSSSPSSGWWICWFGLGLATAGAIVELARKERPAPASQSAVGERAPLS